MRAKNLSDATAEKTDMSPPVAEPAFSDLPSLAISSLETALEALRSCAPPQVQTFMIQPEALAADGAQAFVQMELAALQPRAPTLYRLSITAELEPDRILKAFDLGRQQTPARRYARRHGHGSNVLYIGRSSHLRRRIREHLGFGAPQTYALNLAAWARPLNVPLLLECATYDAHLSDVALGLLEDALWAHSKPMFGRKGSV